MKSLVLIISTFGYFNSFACITCNRAVQNGIYNSAFYPNLLIMLSAFIVLALILLILSWLANQRYRTRMANDHHSVSDAMPLLSAAAVLGIGTGGFADGIVLHQILQWHEMLTARIPADNLVNKSVNMFWDGIFHSFTLITTVVGIYLLWKVLHRENVNKSGYLLSGGMMMGWGLFNIVEGIIDHHILNLHNVYEYSINKPVYNYTFLFFGLALILFGWLLSRKAQR